jgi:hypothetical protein
MNSPSYPMNKQQDRRLIVGASAIITIAIAIIVALTFGSGARSTTGTISSAATEHNAGQVQRVVPFGSNAEYLQWKEGMLALYKGQRLAENQTYADQAQRVVPIRSDAEYLQWKEGMLAFYRAQRLAESVPR